MPETRGTQRRHGNHQPLADVLAGLCVADIAAWVFRTAVRCKVVAELPRAARGVVAARSRARSFRGSVGERPAEGFF
jgi:hypothetical protein